MKKLLLLASVFALILSSCTQDLPIKEEGIELQEVIFTASTDLKYDMFDCENVKPDYALLTFIWDHDGDDDFGYSDPLTDERPADPLDETDEYTPWPGDLNGNDVLEASEEFIRTPVFYVNEVMYTQAIKLPANQNYRLIDMKLYATGAGSGGADLLVNAVPYTGSLYGDLITAPVPVDISVSPFTKSEVPISILCYDDQSHDDFGFTWFRIEENIVRTKYFFGDFCTKFFEEYGAGSGSLYDVLNYTPMVDMPAIMELDLFHVAKDGILYSSPILVEKFTNEASLTTLKPLLLAYPDMEALGDIFQVDVKIHVKTGSTFSYVTFGSWFWNDQEDVLYTSLADAQAGVAGTGFTSGTDGVYDFILGNCNVDGADFIFAPYMNLPESVDISLTSPGTVTGGYFDAVLSDLKVTGQDYDFEAGTYDAYCVDLAHTIGGSFDDAMVHSTLYPENLPYGVVNANWDMINWLINHLDDYNYDMEDATSDFDLSNFQQALWIIVDATEIGNTGVWEMNYTGNVAQAGGIDPIGTGDTGYQMAADALASGHGFSPLPGGWAAVVLNPDNIGVDDEGAETGNFQTIFVRIDP